MLHEKMIDGMTSQAFLETSTFEMKQKALKRWQTMKLSTQNVEDLKEIEAVNILAYMRLDCPDCMLILPLLEMITEINPKIHYAIKPIIANEEEVKSLIAIDSIKVPILIIFDEEELITNLFIERSNDFKKRLKGLDEEDTTELIKRYRRGRYNNQLIQEIIDSLS